MTVAVPHDLIVRRAGEVFERSGRVPGRDKENWIIAERELRMERMAWEGTAPDRAVARAALRQRLDEMREETAKARLELIRRLEKDGKHEAILILVGALGGGHCISISSPSAMQEKWV